MKPIGTIQGYAVTWVDSCERPGDPDTLEKIARGALSVHPECRLDGHHFAASSCAFASDGTLKVGEDETGLWFSADLPPTLAGADILNGLLLKGVLSVSVRMNVLDERRDGDMATVTRGELLAISIMKQGSAAYGRTRCWLAGAVPTEPVARDLAAKFSARSTRTSATPMASVRQDVALERLRLEIAAGRRAQLRRAEVAQTYLARYGFTASARCDSTTLLHVRGGGGGRGSAIFLGRA